MGCADIETETRRVRRPRLPQAQVRHRWRRPPGGPRPSEDGCVHPHEREARLLASPRRRAQGSRRMALRVVLADDSYLIREALSHVLDGAPDIEVVAVCAGSDSLVDAIEAERPDVVLTDIRMPPGDDAEGVHIAARLRETHPGMAVVLLSQYLEPRYALELLTGGSDGRAYLLKDRIHDRDELAAAIHATAAGGSVIDAKVVEMLVDARSRAEES